MSDSNSSGNVGFLRTIGTQDFDLHKFIITRMAAKMWVCTLVQVIKVKSPGGINPVGYVDVQPLVNQIDAAGNPTVHGIIHNVPYFRIQGGTNAVVIDPVIGDIGECSFSHHDISTVKKTRKRSNPGSFRRNSPSDALYKGGFLNGTPTQYVLLDANGITLVSPTKIKLQAPTIEIDGNTTMSGNLSIAGASVTNAGVNISKTHVHTNVQSGTSNTGGPV